MLDAALLPRSEICPRASLSAVVDCPPESSLAWTEKRGTLGALMIGVTTSAPLGLGGKGLSVADCILLSVAVEGLAVAGGSRNIGDI
jgi:hypothetical protein